MDYNTLRNMDLNLLVVLDVLLDEGSVTKASRRLGLTQSAASHALSRLRATFNDPLLVRVGTKMQPTPRAEKLKKDLRLLLSSVRRFMDESDRFDARTTKRTFTLGMQDSMLSMLGSLSKNLIDEAPMARFKFRLANYQAMEEVASNEVMLTIAPMSLQLPSGLTREPIGSLTWSVLMRRNHPAIDGWSPKNWAKWPHLRLGTRKAGPDYIDKRAAAVGVHREIQAVVSHFMMALPILQNTDLLFTNYFQIEESLLGSFGLRKLEIPFRAEPIPIGLVWSSHQDKDPGRFWFQQILSSSLNLLFGENS